MAMSGLSFLGVDPDTAARTGAIADGSGIGSRTVDPLEGIAAADAHLGRPVPLPAAPLPLTRWTEVRDVGPGAVQVEWNLDDSRAGAPGRLVLYAGTRAPASELPPDRGAAATPRTLRANGLELVLREAALAEAQPSLRPAVELDWEAHGLHLRLTAQGPWPVDELLAVAASIGAG